MNTNLSKTARKFKTVLLSIVSIALVLTAFSGVAYAADVEVFQLTTTATAKATCNSATGVVTISGTGDIPGGWAGSEEFNRYSEKESINTIIIEDGITSLYEEMFLDYSNVRTVINYSDELQSIDDGTFNNLGSNLDSSERIALVFSVNTAFITAVEAQGFTVIGEPVKSEGAAPVESTLLVNGTLEATTLSVTHPTSVSYVINPNLSVDAFVASEIPIVNNSEAPINVTVKSLSSTAGGTLQFTDVASDAYSWENLNKADTKTYIALGIKIDNAEGWSGGYNAATRYAVDSGNTLFGTINPGDTAKMVLEAHHGYAFDESYTAAHNLVFMFDLT